MYDRLDDLLSECGIDDEVAQVSYRAPEAPLLTIRVAHPASLAALQRA
jgi:hypothetical protein